MDLETENRIAAILMKEAAELRRQADKEGVHVYLQQPQLRGRPNSRFLTATVLGVQQANRAVEVNEMWRVRQKELELDDQLRGRLREERRNDRSHKNITSSSRTISKRHSSTEKDVSASCSTNERESEDCYSRENGGLRDDEVEEFLQSRVKRGRGAVGSRMDETGPYLPRDSKEKLSTSPYISCKGEWEHRVLGPEKPSLLNAHESSEEDRDQDRRNKKAKKAHSRSLHEHDSRKHRYKKSRDKKKKRKDDKKCRHDK